MPHKSLDRNPMSVLTGSTWIANFGWSSNVPNLRPLQRIN